MINLLQFYFISLLLCFIIFLLFYIFQKRFPNTKDLIWESIIDGLTLNSGIIVLCYLAGKIFSISYFMQIDEYGLYAGLFISSLVLIGGAIDKLRNKNNGEHNAKN